MYTAGPPQPDGDASAVLRLESAGRREFAGSSPEAADPQLRVYLSDLAAPYGLGLREDLLADGAGQSYGEMAGTLLAGMDLAGPAGQPVDLLVLAFAVPDVVPGRSTAAYLSSLCPGSPAAFAICDQGSAAPFTALRVIAEYARTDGCVRALLVLAEQATLHHELAAPAPVPARHAAVALLFGADGPGQLGAVRLRPAVSPQQAAGILAAEIGELSAAGGDLTLIAGAGLSAGPGPSAGPGLSGAAGELITAPAGQPVTGVWWELAGLLPDWAAGRRVVLADYDPVTGCLCSCVVGLRAGSTVAAGGPIAHQAS